jgi:replicative DNA helicase
MGPTNDAEQKLLEKIKRLPPEKAAEVEDFVDFLSQRESERELVRAATRVSENAFANFWDNEDDADYDRL